MTHTLDSTNGIYLYRSRKCEQSRMIKITPSKLSFEDQISFMW